MRRLTYSTQIPLRMTTLIPRFSNQSNLVIEKNRENEAYLPLEICKSKIKGAGFGLKVTADVQYGSLILSYLGVLKPHFEVKNNGDSIFCLGLVKIENEISLVIDPSEIGNAGRFINAAENKKKANCRA